MKHSKHTGKSKHGPKATRSSSKQGSRDITLNKSPKNPPHGTKPVSSNRKLINGKPKQFSPKPSHGEKSDNKNSSGTQKAKGFKPSFKRKEQHTDGKPRPGKKITKEDQERLRVQRKQAHPQADVIPQLLAAWNELRERSTSSERRATLVAQCLQLLRGRVLSVALRHDASRVVQGCLKHGTPTQREAIAAELYGHLLHLAKEKHGHFIVDQMLRSGSPAIRERVRRELKGHIARLLTHSLGALVVERGFREAWNAAQCWDLYQEVYGPEFVNIKVENTTQRTLGAVIVAHPERRKSIQEALFYTLSRQADKGLLSLFVSQKLLAEFFTHAAPEQICALLPSIRDAILAIVASREGAIAASLAFAYATPKERKTMLRSLKGHMLDVACHDHGHLVICAALSATDDTRTSASAVFDELVPHLAYLACHRYGSKVLLHLLAPHSLRYFAATDVKLLQPVSLPAYLANRKEKQSDTAAPPRGGTNTTAKEETVIDTDRKHTPTADGATTVQNRTAIPIAEPPAPTLFPRPPSAELANDATAMALVPCSKKDAETKRRELLQYIRDALLSTCQTHSSVLARSSTGSNVLFEAAVYFASLSANDAKGSGTKTDGPTLLVMEAVADLLIDEPAPIVLRDQIDAMNASARAASYEAQARSAKLLRKAATANIAVSAMSATASSSTALAESVSNAQRNAVSRGTKSNESHFGGGEMENDDEEEDGADEEEAEYDADDTDEVDHKTSANDGADAKQRDEDDGEGDDSRLPILEDNASHLLFKRLLAREARKPSTTTTNSRSDDNSAHDSTQASLPTPVFGNLVLERVKPTGLAALATSNRACYVLEQLVLSRDTHVASAAVAGLVKDSERIRSLPPSAGRDALLAALVHSTSSTLSSGSKRKHPQSTPAADEDTNIGDTDAPKRNRDSKNVTKRTTVVKSAPLTKRPR